VTKRRLVQAVRREQTGIPADTELMSLQRPCASRTNRIPQRNEITKLPAGKSFQRPASLQQLSMTPPRSDNIRNSSAGSEADMDDIHSISLSSPNLPDQFCRNNAVAADENYNLEENADNDVIVLQNRSMDQGGERNNSSDEMNKDEDENDAYDAAQDNVGCEESVGLNSLRPRNFRPPRATVPIGSDAHSSLSILDRIIHEQTDRLGVRNDPKLWHTHTGRRGIALRGKKSRIDLSSGSESECDDLENSVIRRWARYLKSLPNDFFTAKEARMELERAAEAGDEAHHRCSPYAGLLLRHSPLNCPDILYCYEQCFEIKIRRGGRAESYHQFKAAAGQLARFSVAAEVASAENFGKPGGLFDLVRSSRLIRAFIGGFQQNAQPSTVYAKATLLGTLCRMAKQHFGKLASVETPAILSHIDETANLLSGFRRVEKATSRRLTAVLRDQDSRETFISPRDWFWLQRKIEEDMRRIWTGISGLQESLGPEVASYMDENHNLVRKYSLLLLIYIVLTGGGQRPQVYTSLQHPAERVVSGWEDESGNSAGGPVKLYPTSEKTPRGTFSPGILFPEISSSFFATYIRIIRPEVMRRSGRAANDLADVGRVFLVHTETGRPLSGENLRNTLRLYFSGLQGLSGDLSRVTVMTVRASFASMMFRSFRNGEFSGRCFEEFLSELAETMNTSVEMLRNTYIIANGVEFDDAASAFLRASRAE
jgi:hypothetical protein